MAGERRILVKFDGQDMGLDKTASKVADSLDEVDDAGRRAGEGLDAVGEGAGTLDTRAMGFRDTITGVQDSMAGWGQLMEGDVAGGLFTLGMGVGDLASGVENLVVPIVQSGATWITTHASMAASSVASAASAVASWVAMAAASVVNAAVVAASWLLAFAPVIIVVAIVIALVVVIIKNWDRIKEVIQAGWEFVRRISSAVWEGIKAVVSAAVQFLVGMIQQRINLIRTVISAGWNAIKAVTSAIWNGIKTVLSATWNVVSSLISTKLNLILAGFRRFQGVVRSIFRGVGQAITAPIRGAMNGIRSAWNSTIGGKGISIPGFRGFGGISFRIPTLAQGGLAFGPTLAAVGDNPGASADPEVIAPLSKLRGMMGGGGPVEVRLIIDSRGSGLDDVLLEIIRKAVSIEGGQVQDSLGAV